MRLIDADEFERTLNMCIGMESGFISINGNLLRNSIAMDNTKIANEIKKLLRFAPTVDAVPREKVEVELADMELDVIEVNLENAVNFLNEIGWMQEHDRFITSNAVPIVRCKDCSKWGTRLCCVMTSPDFGMGTEDFCSHGEKKSDITARWLINGHAVGFLECSNCGEIVDCYRGPCPVECPKCHAYMENGGK